MKNYGGHNRWGEQVSVKSKCLLTFFMTDMVELNSSTSTIQILKDICYEIILQPFSAAAKPRPKFLGCGSCVISNEGLLRE